MLIAFNKPYGVLCQFSPVPGKATLADYIDVPDVYAAGRLDFDSEGLLLLTDDGALQHAIAHPATKLGKRYWAQVEGAVDEQALAPLHTGVQLNDGCALPAKARCIEEPPQLWPRHPPIRSRARIPTSWLEIEISEGKNRQVRRMTAALGYPTLRLIRCAIGALDLLALELAPGQWTALTTLQLDLSEPHKKSLSTDFTKRRYRE